MVRTTTGSASILLAMPPSLAASPVCTLRE